MSENCRKIVAQKDGDASPVNPNILPERESPYRSYPDEECLAPRPRREKIRGEIADYVLLSLGAPALDLELDQQQLSICVDKALRVFEEWAPQSFFQYYTFQTMAYVSNYKLPCDIGIIADVTYTSKSCDLATQFGGGQPLGWIGDTGYGAGGLAWGAWGYNRYQPYWGYAGEWVLFKQYEETFERISSRNGGWEYVEDEHTLKLYPVPQQDGGVVSVHYLQRQKDWTQVHQWMEEYALALAKIILGRIRSKFSTIVSPGGGVTLDGQNLLAEGNEEKKQLEKDLVYKYNDWGIHILMG